MATDPNQTIQDSRKAAMSFLNAAKAKEEQRRTRGATVPPGGGSAKNSAIDSFLSAGKRNEARAEAAKKGEETDFDLAQRIRQMSKGTREKVQLILVMSRRARLYLLDEPIGGVDPATRDYILETIIRNYDEEASVLISTHLISDVENVLDDVIFLNQGKVTLQSSVDDIREQYGKSVDALFREVFRC